MEAGLPLHFQGQLSFSWPNRQEAHYPRVMGVEAKGKSPSSHRPRPT